MDGGSMDVDGEALVMMIATISSKSPSRQGARTEFMTLGRGFTMAAEFRKGFVKSDYSPDVFRSRESHEGVPEATTPSAGAAMGPPRRQVVWAPLPLSISSSGSGSLRVK